MPEDRPLGDEAGVCREIEYPTAEGPELLQFEGEPGRTVLDPLRWRALETIGHGKSLPALSNELGVTDARLLYHLQRLADVGAVVLHRTDSTSKGWHCMPAARKLRVRVDDTAATEEDPIPESISDDFNQAAREVREGLYGTGRPVSVNHNRSRLSEEQAAEFNRRLFALIEEFFPPGKGDQTGIKYGFHGVFTPIDLHPFEDSEG